MDSSGFLDFEVIAALQGPPQQSAKYANLIGVIIVYKWSSENRFFSTKLSLGVNDAIMGRFGKLLIIKGL